MPKTVQSEFKPPEVDFSRAVLVRAEATFWNGGPPVLVRRILVPIAPVVEVASPLLRLKAVCLLVDVDIRPPGHGRVRPN